jgi:hypothetical protein
MSQLTDHSLYWAAGLLLACLVIGLMLAARRRRPSFRVAKRAFLTENEKEFLLRLEEAFPEHRIMAQVSMGALMSPDVPGGSEYLSIRGRFAQKVVDYVVLDDALEVIALVELDDRTHRLEKDAVRDAMTAAAGYVTLRYRSREKPAPKAIRAELSALHSALRR